MEIMTLKQIKDGLKGCNPRIVAKSIGTVSHTTVYALQRGEENNYTIETIKAVSEYLIRQQGSKND